MIERMPLIMEAFGDRAARLRLDEIAAHTGLPRSTSHRILEQLVRLGWLRHTQGGYALGQRALQLGGSVSNHAEIRAAAVPLLEELHARPGKAMLAWLPPEEADTLLEGGMKARTHNTITNLMVMHQELRRIRGRHP